MNGVSVFIWSDSREDKGQRDGVRGGREPENFLTSRVELFRNSYEPNRAGSRATNLQHVEGQ